MTVETIPTVELCLDKDDMLHLLNLPSMQHSKLLTGIGYLVTYLSHGNYDSVRIYRDRDDIMASYTSESGRRFFMAAVWQESIGEWGDTLMKTYDVDVKQFVTVKLDETKFTPEWMAHFRENFRDLYEVSDHAEHLAFVAARGALDWIDPVVEGYGRLSDMGIEIDVEDPEVELRGVR